MIGRGLLLAMEGHVNMAQVEMAAYTGSRRKAGDRGRGLTANRTIGVHAATRRSFAWRTFDRFVKGSILQSEIVDPTGQNWCAMGQGAFQNGRLFETP